MAGEPVAGTVLEHSSKRPGREPMQFGPVIVEAQPGKVLVWEGRLFLPRLFDDYHRFEIEALERFDLPGAPLWMLRCRNLRNRMGERAHEGAEERWQF